VIGACTTHTVTTRTSLAGSEPAPTGITQHGFVNGELVLRFTPEGERVLTPTTGVNQGWLRFGVPSLDQLNAKYHATSLVPVQGEKGVYRLKIAPDANVLRAAEDYGRDPLVARAEPNYLLKVRRPAEAQTSTTPDTVRIQR